MGICKKLRKIQFELQTKPSYPFGEKDNDNNIQIKKEPGREVVLAGTVEKLVERLTSDKFTGEMSYLSKMTSECQGDWHVTDTDFKSAFLTSLHTFLTPRKLWELLMHRYHMPQPIDQSADVSLQRCSASIFSCFYHFWKWGKNINEKMMMRRNFEIFYEFSWQFLNKE